MELSYPSAPASRSSDGDSNSRMLPPRQLDWVSDGSVDLHGRPVRRALTGCWRAALFIIGGEFSERLSYYGIASNLITYMTTVLHESLASAAKNANNWSGVTLVVPLVGAFFADAYFGKYWTIATVSGVYVIGLLLLTLSVSVSSLKPPPCATDGICPRASRGQLGFFFFSLYLISVGTGGVKPCLEAFGADQFEEENREERRMKASFFNWWYFGLCMGAMVAFTFLVYIQDNVSWGLGFGIPAIAMAFALATFMVGTKYYRHKVPAGSPLTRVAKVVVAAFCKRRMTLPHSPDLLYEVIDKESIRVGRRKLSHTDNLRFLDKAAIIEDGDFSSNQCSWNLCTVTQVEEVKLIVCILPVWLAMLTYGVVFAQTSTIFTKQGSTMDRKMGSNFEIPAASLQSITTIVIVTLLPIYDRAFVPIVSRLTGHRRGITMLQRIGFGLFLSILSMIAAAITERKRIDAARDHGLLDSPTSIIPLSIFWLLPQYILSGISDVFAIVGQQEFFYDQVPDTTRSFGMALYLCAIGVGSFLSSLLITIIETITGAGSRSWFTSNINRGHLDYFYWLLAVLSTMNLIMYSMISHAYDYKAVEKRNDHDAEKPV
ncbi:hypothetical protein GOP47_0013547 [Adiantum capillus-veneris]|uniref:Uncharacterized protein n=1 Tax=Adiantum capillus-veneris TaxID=13818 RepID=A0A9D4UPF3_ADICA|nr:hypothetical protein GOP47_0013547 [Adiantum capillus-veneris]